MELIGQIVGMAAVTFGGSLLFSFRRVRNAWTIGLFFAYFWVALAVSAGVWFAAHRDQIESVKAGNLPPDYSTMWFFASLTCLLGFGFVVGALLDRATRAAQAATRALEQSRNKTG